MKNDKLFAPFLTLLALAIALLCTIRWHYSLLETLCVLLIVLIVFYAIGSLIQRRVNKFIADNEEKAREAAEKEGSVIEKDGPDDFDDFDEEENIDISENRRARRRNGDDSEET